MQEKKHPLLSFLMPPAVRGATLRVAGLGVAACGGGLGCCWHRLLPRYAWRGLSRCGAIGDAVSLSCSCKKVTKEARQRGRRSHAAAPFGIPFWLLVRLAILLRRW